MTTTPGHVHDYSGSRQICTVCGVSNDDECRFGHPRTDDSTYILASGAKRCKPCEQARQKRHREANLVRVREKGRNSAADHRQRAKDAVFDYYGRECACCGETEPAFLSIDHINGNGNDHRREISGGRKSGGGSYIYRWLVANGLPTGFQTLCFNCNHAKHVLGVCPHQTRSV